MHGYSRLGRASGSPPSSPRFRRHSKGRGGGVGVGVGVDVKLLERWVYAVISAVYRRRGVLLFAPLLYVSAMLLYMGTMGFHLGFTTTTPSSSSAPLGSLYRSPQLFQHLWPYIQPQNNPTNNDLMMNVWNIKSRPSWKPCNNLQNSQAELPKSNGFLIIEANGGLNQQRLSICDAVAVAGLLNATLVIPIFHLNSVWRDSSKFGDIFDEEFFIYALRHHVNVVRELPADILERFDNNISNIVNLRVKGWSSPTYYLQKVLPRLLELGAVRIAPFSNRLAHAVPSEIQGLRCLSNFGALRFSEPIRTLAAKMVDKMIQNASTSGGKYISVHLRFEEDMVAFSCCVYDGGEEEQREMDIARERSWRGKFRKKNRIIRPGAIRMDGKCPLTPLEVGMMLRGMGFDNNTSVYVAAGKIYKAEKYMAPLKQMFPRLETKDTLASPEELAPFMGYSSRLAALDYTICLYSEVFVTTQGGNFPHFLIGHRRYSYEGHAKTIIPDKRKLAQLFDSPHIRWESFQRQLREMLHHSDVKGSEIRKPSASLFMYPMPDCMCKQAAAKNSTR
ncbi:putative GDP-fucose protein O-fucosyltransferase [Helianthus annuus]|uniref:O-fucosyltransferase family protein n=1 Tax=Helianthus annuus TaxID=4232 RepID=A0A251VFD6_HELAN|nr:O-fucosyltransferase 9 [Helianthus annuus]KAF5818311.1 putative GDP-fucose protein O-fucosyltransferase [Helianthus annuus]KAJ0604621.1 putative GDP-fucose protein O-fucosyltransferase [Helianthus annuus]KAJ0615150.1 putative GDP-fucose protein O-fucosyltransferase [Helianthus annuus]KAJ0618634.1 putative GDP-fucose protein O-fucosyltransferase [Helianthus annuus]KAJ0777092.1 putative GDP-fucose protein O-fucosyltransferase [Helianthus annuus]